jgi:hypothetical protein
MKEEHVHNRGSYPGAITKKEAVIQDQDDLIPALAG